MISRSELPPPRESFVHRNAMLVGLLLAKVR